jgi:hypothetical protein
LPYEFSPNCSRIRRHFCPPLPTLCPHPTANILPASKV